MAPQTHGTIHFDEMLARIAVGGPTPFRIVYVIGQGKNKGQIREYNAWYGAPNPKAIHAATSAQTAEPGTRRKLHMESGTLPFTEFSSRRLLTLFVYNILHFNGKQVIS